MINRRRTLSIMAGTAAAFLPGCRPGRGQQVTRWNGVLFNAEADLALHGLPAEEAEELIERCVAEMVRLEEIFSLYLPESVLVSLNRDGYVENPPNEFVALVSQALEIASQSEGAFDPTIQPYWTWLREEIESGSQPSEQQRREQLEMVDHKAVFCSAERVSFGKEGMGLTLNGIAQGWITDAVTDLLRDTGVEHSLVNLGEFHALGPQPSGDPWLVGLRGAEDQEVALQNSALAVSAGSGFFFGTGAGENHLIDPRTGSCAQDRRIVAVTAAKAALADALSTACAVLSDEEGRELVSKWPDAELRIVPS